MKITISLEDMFSHGEEKEITIVFSGGQIHFYLDGKSLDEDSNAFLELVNGEVKFIAFKEGEINPYIDQTIY